MDNCLCRQLIPCRDLKVVLGWWQKKALAVPSRPEKNESFWFGGIRKSA